MSLLNYVFGGISFVGTQKNKVCLQQHCIPHNRSNTEFVLAIVMLNIFMYMYSSGIFFCTPVADPEGPPPPFGQNYVVSNFT